MKMLLSTAQVSGGSNPMSFTENQQGNAVLEQLRQQRETGAFCDVVIVVGGRRLPAHRSILAACSPYFDSILKSNKVVKEQVTVNSGNADAFELLLNYMYSGSVMIDRNSVMDLLKLANNFLVTKLKNYCAEYLDRYLDASNCLTVKQLAKKYNMPGLYKNASLYLESNVNRCLTESSDVLDYSLARVDQLICDPNYDIQPGAHLKFIVRWVGKCIKERECSFKQLLSVVALGAISRDLLYHLLGFDPLFQASETCTFALLQAMYENSIPLQQFEAQYQQLLAKHSGEVNVYFAESNPPPALPPSALQSLSASSPPSGDVPVSSAEHQSAESGSAVNDFDSMMDGGHIEGHSQSSRRPRADALTAPKMEIVFESVIGGGLTAAREVADIESEFSRVVDQEEQGGIIMERTQIQTDGAHSSTGAIEKQSILESLSSSIGAENGSNFSVMTAATTAPISVSAAGGGTPSNTYIRPSLKLTLKLPPALMNRKARILGARQRTQMYRSKVSAAVSMNRRRGRPPKFRAIRLSADVISAGDMGPLIREDETGSLVVDDGRARNGAEVLFKCPHCVYTSNAQARIQAHINKAHSRNVIYVCNVCNYQCKWNREYYMHMKQHFEGPPFKCDTCDYSGDRIQMLLTHRMKHTDERPYKCTECDYRCRTKTNLMAHMRSHTGEKPFGCPECGRGFAIKSTLDQHLATHSDTRPFRCDQCDFSTKYQSHLISHKRIHTGDVFKCQFPDCTYSSPKKSQLAAHLRTHLAVRAHSCRICGRAFIEKSHLVRHERIHLAEKPFKCEHCEYASSRRDKLKEHIQKHHGSQQGARQQRRKYRRAKQLAALAARHQALRASGLMLSGSVGDRDDMSDRLPSSSLGSADVTKGMFIAPVGSQFRPIMPAVHTSTTEHNHPPPTAYQTQTVGAGGHQQQQQQLDLNQLLQTPSPSSMNRPSSTILPAGLDGQHANQPSPALSLNFNLGYETPVLPPGKDVMLSTQAAPTPTQEDTTLVTPVPRSPHSLHNDAAASYCGAPPLLNRPMSLPPLGGQTAATSTATSWGQQLTDFSFPAEF